MVSQQGRFTPPHNLTEKAYSDREASIRALLHTHAWERDEPGCWPVAHCEPLRAGRQGARWMDSPRRCGSPVCLITPGRRARAGSTGSWPTGMGVTARRRSAGAPCRTGPRSWSVTTCWRAVLHLRYLHESWRRFPTSHEFRGNR